VKGEQVEPMTQEKSRLNERLWVYKAARMGM
jgi:hypothetical protein